jgi:hypothetical protein
VRRTRAVLVIVGMLLLGSAAGSPSALAGSARPAAQVAIPPTIKMPSGCSEGKVAFLYYPLSIIQLTPQPLQCAAASGYIVGAGDFVVQEATGLPAPHAWQGTHIAPFGNPVHLGSCGGCFYVPPGTRWRAEVAYLVTAKATGLTYYVRQFTAVQVAF